MQEHFNPPVVKHHIMWYYIYYITNFLTFRKIDKLLTVSFLYRKERIILDSLLDWVSVYELCNFKDVTDIDGLIHCYIDNGYSLCYWSKHNIFSVYHEGKCVVSSFHILDMLSQDEIQHIISLIKRDMDGKDIPQVTWQDKI